MNFLLNDIGVLIGMIYTIAMLGHILHKGFISEALASEAKS